MTAPTPAAPVLPWMRALTDSLMATFCPEGHDEDEWRQVCDHIARAYALAGADDANPDPELARLRAENERLTKLVEASAVAHLQAAEACRERDEAERERNQFHKECDAALNRSAREVETSAALRARVAELEKERDRLRNNNSTLAAHLGDVERERDEAVKQQKLAWERAAEKDRYYGNALEQRDAARADADRLAEALETARESCVWSWNNSLGSQGIMFDLAAKALSVIKGALAAHDDARKEGT